MERVAEEAKYEKEEMTNTKQITVTNASMACDLVLSTLTFLKGGTNP